MTATEVMGFIACLSLTALSVYGLVVFRRFSRNLAEMEAELRKCVEEERNGRTY